MFFQIEALKEQDSDYSVFCQIVSSLYSGAINLWVLGTAL